MKTSQVEFDGTMEKFTRAIACPALCLLTTPVVETLKHIVSRYTDFIWAIMKPLGPWAVFAIAGLSRIGGGLHHSLRYRIQRREGCARETDFEDDIQQDSPLV